VVRPLASCGQQGRQMKGMKQIDAGVLNVRIAHCRHIQPYKRHSS
jgi:hypothetical protein